MVGAAELGPAVRALGSLFKLTEVFLWEDGSTETKDMSFSLGRTKAAQDSGDGGSNDMASECGILPEDMELTRQMNALGLPVSFRTNKQMTKRMTQGKRKGMRLQNLDVSEEAGGGVLDSSKVSVGEIVSPIIFDDNQSSSLCCMSMMGQRESSSSDIAADATQLHCPYVEGENPASLMETTSNSSKEQSHDVLFNIDCNDGEDCNSVHKISARSTDLDCVLCPGSCSADAAVTHDKTEPDERIMEHDHLECSIMACHETELTTPSENHVLGEPCVSESVSYSMCPEVLNNDGIDGQQSGDFGDWIVHWDSYYMRNYFYNSRTHNSTWYLPLGMEHLAMVDTTYNSNEVVDEVTELYATTDLKATDLCSSSEIRSFEEPINGGLHGQLYHELSKGIGVNVGNYVSDSTLPCPELSDELNASNNSCHDGNAPCLSSNVQEHNSRNETMQLVSVEVCNSDMQPIVAEKTDDFGLYDEFNKVYSYDENPKSYKDDDTVQILDWSSLSMKCIDEDTEDGIMHPETGVPVISELEMICIPAVGKRKKKVRRIRSQRKLFNESEEILFQGLLKDCSADIGKYWCQRYLLFSRYDDGIKMDEEGWFSVTPEPLARHHAKRCGSGSIIDCFTGVGGNSIQFAHISKHIIAIDIDPAKIDYAQHNAAIYGVAEWIDFLKGDFFCLAPRLKADTVFLSPPWGGPDYASEKTYNIKILKPRDGYYLFTVAKQVAPRVVMFLPRNVDINQLAELSLSASPPWSLEVEKNFVNGKLKGITAYFIDTALS